ncbi:hypothetical protein ATO10_12204 [Actibacterium atlanticum]|uniref:Uncharacterized protein n=1 Tax=Actibacterium atlanticum TaxID=1461693 RepID=A0A058ZIH5_9RHOB|nr:M15 family metallopeptidase [Actibacterium atlanticum]KCV81368.1 hypothetical protein ATO10_12204 [Actibacterium atlanticum]
MDNRHLQMVMAAAGAYGGGIDGILGAMSEAAMREIETRHAALYTFDPTSTTENRRKTGVLQACLNELGFEPGFVDGWYGNITGEALNAFLYRTTNGTDEVIDRTPLTGTTLPEDLPTRAQCTSVYGDPEHEVPQRVITIELPFSYRLDWNLRKKTNRVTVHRDAAPSLEAALIAVHNHYGPAQMTALGLDRYAGAYNKRRVRGGSSWSMHAYGCAIDFYAAPNGLRTECPQALFCGPPYQAFLDIMETHGWLPAIRLWGADAMHFQRARL